MSQVVSFYNVSPDDLKCGDVLVCTVTLHVGWHMDSEGKPMYRVYRCDYPPQVSDGIPQGANLGAFQQQVAEALFPVVQLAGLNPD